MPNLTFDAGKIVRLTSDIHVVLGTVVDVTLHPSGTQFDGPAVVVGAFGTMLGANIVQVVSLKDPAGRIVTEKAENFPGAFSPAE